MIKPYIETDKLKAMDSTKQWEIVGFDKNTFEQKVKWSDGNSFFGTEEEAISQCFVVDYFYKCISYCYDIT